MREQEKNKGTKSSFQKTVDILLPFLIYFAVHDAAQILLAFLLDASFDIMGAAYTQAVKKNSVSVGAVLNAAALFIGMAAVLPMARKEIRESVSVSEQMCRKNRIYSGAAYGLLLILAVSAAVGMNLLFSFTGFTGSSKQYEEIAQRQFGVAFGLGLLLYGILSPLAEEIVFRGLIYNRMKRYFSACMSVVICGILFGIYHGNPVQALYGSIMGILITLMYEWYGSFAAPLLFHAAANVSVFLISYQGKIAKEHLSLPAICLCFLIAFVSFTAIAKIVKRQK